MADEHVARLERLVAWRRGEEERARRREVRQLSAAEAAAERLRRLQMQLRACRKHAEVDAAGGAGLLDAHHCAARLSELVQMRQAEHDEARRSLAQARDALAEAGRRRLAVERVAAARALRVRDAEEAACQADADESGRLRLLTEGD